MRRLAIIIALTATTATAQERFAEIDGDTLKGSEPIAVIIEEPRYRVLGLETPEKGGRADCPLERAAAPRATAALREYLDRGAQPVPPFKLDSFGSVLARIDYKGEDVAELMIERKLGVAWVGKAHRWCEGATMWSPMPVARK
ncbi:MAG: hypothetical protein AAFR84_03040 [Pseudomonadota bacterium]